MDDPKSNEVEITPEMVQVATEILWESGRLEYEAEGADQLVVEEMLRAALSGRRGQSLPSGKQKSSPMTNLPAKVSLLIQLIMDRFPGSEIWGFLPTLLCEHVCHSQPYFHSFDRKERCRERFSMFSIRKAHATNQPARGHEQQEKLGLNAGPNPQAFAMSCREYFQLGGCFFGFLDHYSTSSRLRKSAQLLAALCIFYVAPGAYGAKVDLISFLDPIRAEACLMGGVERVPIIDKTVEQEGFVPGLDTYDVRLRKNSMLFVTMVPIWGNNEFRKVSIYSVVRSPVRDRIG